MGLFGSWTKSLEKILEYAVPVATAAATVAPLFAQQSQPELPKVERGKTMAELEMEQTEAATDRRRELARKRGMSSTFRTTKLGITNGGTAVRSRPILGAR